MKITFATLCAVALMLIPSSILAQVSQGGQPFGWGDQLDGTPFFRTAELDMEPISLEDAENDQYKEFAYRFGIEHTVSLTPESHGTWTETDDMKVWKLGVHCPNAKAISVRFNEYELPTGARVFVYDADQTHYIGSFTAENKQANGMLATSLVYSENVIVQLELPNKFERSDVALSIDQVVHAYRGMASRFEELTNANRGPFGNSGACNININCPEGDDWQVESKSVALIVSGGSGVCSGALVNNTNNDGHPYFLTANHCLGGVGNWVFYFNHEAANCNGNSGPTNQTVSGATLLASNAGSDFGLLEINNGNAIPASFNAEFAGWDNSDSEAAVTGATGIHHPSSDVKKICHENDAPYHNTQGNAAVWYIDEWEEGVTEGGSSGSPLFDQNHRIIGQLYGGWAACSGNVNNGEPDWYGRFGVSWDGNSSSTRLRDWLDPNNTGVTTLDGYPTGAVTYALDAQSAGLSQLPEELCTPETVTPVFTLKNNGTTALTSCTITYSYNGGTDQQMNWTGNLLQDATEEITLASFTPVVGTNNIDVTVSNPNGTNDENNANNNSSGSFELTVGEEVLNLTIVTDNFGYETYWEVRGPNNQLVASGGNTAVGADGGGEQVAQEGDPGAYGDNQTINETIALDGDGCYTFLIVDDYGDGICCGFTGNGEYTLRDGNNIIMGSGGQFDETEEKEFGMVNGLSVSDLDRSMFSIFPNPTTGITELMFANGTSLNGTVTVSDISGRVVLNQRLNKVSQITLDLSSFESGLYMVTVSNEQLTVTERVLLK